MKIKLREVTVAELVDGYVHNDEKGVIGYGGKLDIRPPYQREFIYNDDQQKAVIDTLRKDFPLNVMYWAVRDDGGFEMIDGQQRTLSICKYATGKFSYDNLYFDNLKDHEKTQINNYKLTVYLCTGDGREKLEWFQTINIAGEKLTDQELRNAVYSGSWVSSAREYFSKTGCVAYQIGGDYLTGSAIRQDYLETVIKWKADGKNKIEDYMAKNQNKKDAKELWKYFQSVIDWTKKVFPKYRREMKGLDWGGFYNRHKKR